MSLDALLHFDDTRLRLAAAKLTHVGPQTGPVGTIVFQAYFYLPSLDKFRPWQTPRVSYRNDELPFIYNFSISPEEFRRVLEQAKGVWDSVKQEKERFSLSFSALVDAPDGIKGTELLFSHEGGVALHRALAVAIDQDNKIGQIVLQKGRESAYSDA